MTEYLYLVRRTIWHGQPVVMQKGRKTCYIAIQLQ